VVSLTNSSVAISVFELQHLQLARRQLAELGRQRAH
jgi:hypothetical protein